MGPEFWISLGAVFLAGGAVGMAGTLLTQWLLRKVDGGPIDAVSATEHEALRREVAQLGRRMRNIDTRLDFTEQLLGGALPLSPPPERLNPQSEAELEETEVDAESREADSGEVP